MVIPVLVTVVPLMARRQRPVSRRCVTSAVVPSGEMATSTGPGTGSSCTCPTRDKVLPAIEKTVTVPSPVLATSARVPARLIDTPLAPAPARRVWSTTGRVGSGRSMTDAVSSSTNFARSAGSNFCAAVTRAKRASRATATLGGGPIMLSGTGTVPTTLGG